MRRRLMAALWPSFLMAAVLEGLVFSLLDPTLLEPRIAAAGLPPLALYSLAFLGFWAITALSSGLSLLLAD
ncbi:hypothetical protein G8A07_10440 [Roseateles sp. DAIF2]|nr:hypothetical protein G8A07_10440 [Roseateles sp. DAIF2]